MRLPLSPEVLTREVDRAIELLEALRSAIDRGIPGVTVPGEEAHLGEWLVQFTGEMMYAARTCENIATSLAEPPGTS